MHANLAEILLIGILSHLRDDFFLMDVLFQGQEDLRGVDGLDEIVGNFGTDGLVHDILLFAFRHHDHRRDRCDFLDARQGFQPAQAGHVLVQQNQVVGRFAALVQCILPVGYGFYLVSFLFEKKNMRFQQFYFIVYPK